jgi:hypothetical protein
LHIAESNCDVQERPVQGFAAFSLDVSESVLPTDIERLVVGHDEESVRRYWRSNVDRVESGEDQERLRDALIERIWARRGGDIEESDGDIEESDGDSFDM